MNWVAKKGLISLLTVFVVITLSFFLVRLMPGNPVDTWVMQQVQLGMAKSEAYKLASVVFSIDVTLPLYLQYFSFLSSVAQGSLGVSMLSTGTPVTLIIAARLPYTVFMTSISLSVSFAIGVLLGMFIAYRRGSKIDSVFFFLGSLSTSIPSYMIALVFLVVFAFKLGWFPYSGAYDPHISPGFTLEFVGSIFRYAFLPLLSFVATTFGGWMLSMRSSTVSVLGEDYITVAEARGLSDRRITMSYVGRNAILPLFTSLAIQIGYLFGGSIFIETTFRYPGVGMTLASSISMRDYTLAEGCFIVIAIAIVLANFLADVFYGKLDPRIRRR